MMKRMVNNLGVTFDNMIQKFQKTKKTLWEETHGFFICYAILDFIYIAGSLVDVFAVDPHGNM